MYSSSAAYVTDPSVSFDHVTYMQHAAMKKKHIRTIVRDLMFVIMNCAELFTLICLIVFAFRKNIRHLDFISESWINWSWKAFRCVDDH